MFKALALDTVHLGLILGAATHGSLSTIRSDPEQSQGGALIIAGH